MHMMLGLRLTRFTISLALTQVDGTRIPTNSSLAQ